MTHCVYARVQPMQSPGANPPADCVSLKPQANQLTPRHHPVLPVGEL
jgi:hypothetical protein